MTVAAVNLIQKVPFHQSNAFQFFPLTQATVAAAVMAIEVMVLVVVVVWVMKPLAVRDSCTSAFTSAPPFRLSMHCPETQNSLFSLILGII